MVSRNPDDSPILPSVVKTVKGFALHITSEKPGEKGSVTMLGLLVAPSAAKLQETLDFLRTCPPIAITPAMLTGAKVEVNQPPA